MASITLVSMPWAALEFPSIQIARLKSYLASQGIKVTNKHYYLEYGNKIGVENYRCLAQSDIMLGEILFSELLFKKDGNDSENYREQYKDFFKDLSFTCNELIKMLQSVSFDIVDHLATSEDQYIGFTVVYHQLTSTLYIAEQLKARAPEKRIVLGGALCRGKLGVDLLCKFPYIDFVVNGEGEEPLAQLVKEEMPYEQIAGLIYRKGDKIVSNPPQIMSISLDDLPYPDYSDYFERYKESSNILDHMPLGDTIIPVEGSRGCWWNKCSFCNLNFQYSEKVKFRSRTPEKVVAELKEQSAKYRNNKIYFVDSINYHIAKLADEIIGTGRDYRIGHECRAEVTLTDVAKMKQAGFDMVQVGVESFSTSILRKMKKGARMIDNIQAIKFFDLFKLKVVYNIIPYFPNETKEEILEMMEILPYLFHLTPPQSMSKFTLGYCSDVYTNYSEYNIKELKVKDHFKKIFPEEIIENTTFSSYGFVSSSSLKEEWKDFFKLWETWKEKKEKGVYLVYYDLGEVVIIEDTRFGNKKTYYLEGYDREIYLSCFQITKYDDLKAKLADFDEKLLYQTLYSLYKHKLLIEEEGALLSLAMPGDSRSIKMVKNI